MMNDAQRKLGSTLDWTLISCYILLVLSGVLNIYASIQVDDPVSLFAGRSGKQLLWFGISFIVGILILFVLNPQIWESISIPAYATVAILLIAVIFLSRDVKGSHSWFSLGPISFQPAEISKITTSLLLALVLGKPGFKFSNPRDYLTAAGIVVLPMLIIVAESETGSALVYIGYLFALYLAGLSGWYIVLLGMVIFFFILTLMTSRTISLAVLTVIVGVLAFSFLRKHGRNLRHRRKVIRNAVAGLVAGALFIFAVGFVFENVLKEHQRSRIEVLLGIKDDPMGYGYNVRQSMIAIGSGGFGGKGYLQGTQTAYGFVPEQSTDFIFCTVGEEWGFIGCLFVLSLYGLLIFRIIQDAEEARSPFTRIYGYCVASCLFMHLFINIGMTIGLMPVIGIPLPFVSYGGSSLLSFTVMLSIFISMVRQERKYF